MTRTMLSWYQAKLLAFFVFICPSFLFALPQNVEVSTVSEVTSVAPGDTFLLGVRFQLKDGWHTYWKNPGDAGLPTRIKHVGGKALSFSPLLWPAPTTFNQGGELVGYGYENEVVLLSRGTVASDAPAGGNTTVTSDIRWLLCSDSLCVPGKKRIETSVTISEKTVKGPHAQMLVNWSQKVPVESFSDVSPWNVTHTGDLAAGTIQITVTPTSEASKTKPAFRWYVYADKAFTLSLSQPKSTHNTQTFTVSVSQKPGSSPKRREVELVGVANSAAPIRYRLSL